MNITRKEFIHALRRSSENVRGVVGRYRAEDDELQEHHVDELEWMLSQAAKLLEEDAAERTALRAALARAAAPHARDCASHTRPDLGASTECDCGVAAALATR